MGYLKKRMLRTILGPVNQAGLDHIIITALVFCLVVVSGLLFCTDMMFNRGPRHHIFSLAMTIISAYLYLRVRQTSSFRKYLWILTAIFFSAIIYTWRMTGGVSGVSSLATFAFAVVVPIIFQHRTRHIILISLGVLYSCLFFAEITWPQFVILHDSRTSYLTDYAISLVFIGMGISFAMSLVMRSHMNQYVRIKSLNGSLSDMNELLIKQNQELQTALLEINTLKGIIPICSNCKKIRDDKGVWNHLEAYIQRHSEAEFSHGMCHECTRELYPDCI